jgi:hypothetical protein
MTPPLFRPGIGGGGIFRGSPIVPPSGIVVSPGPGPDPEPPPPPPFDMTALDGFLAGWDASSSEMVNAYDDLDPVSTWFSFGSDYPLVNSTPSKRPTYRAEGINGMPSVFFSQPAGQHLIRTGLWGGSTQGITIYAVVHLTETSTGNWNSPLIAMPSYGTANGSEALYIRPRNDQTAGRQITLALRTNTTSTGGSTVRSGTTVTVPNGNWPLSPVVVCMTWDGAGDRVMRLRTNGVEVRTLTTAYVWHLWTNTLRLGHEGTESSVQTWRGHVSHVSFYGAKHDDATVEDVEVFLGNKHGIAL